MPKKRRRKEDKEDETPRYRTDTWSKSDLDKYEDDKKFGKDKISYTFRIVYRSPERTLTNVEINEIQAKIREKTEQELNAVLR